MNRAAVVCAVAAVVIGAAAQTQNSDALINKLVDKGILTLDEAREIQSDLAKEQKAPPKWKINTALTSVELFGDARLRFEHREAQDLANDMLARDRFRYRLRLGLRGEFKEDFYYGLRFETGTNPRSVNITFGDDAGPWGRGSDVINVGRIYLGWRASDWLSLEAGRMANPLKTSTMVWDSDLNPEGAVERFNYKLGNLDAFATFGQFLYDDANPDNPLGGVPKNDAFMLAWQVGGKYNFNNDLSLTIAPVVYNYTGHGDDNGFNNIFTTTSQANFAGINDLLVIEVPVEFGFKLAGLPAMLFADFAVNTEAGDRRDRAVVAGGVSGVPAGAGNEDKAYQIGLSLGKASKKGTWDGKAYWQHAELFSLDPNLVDSDAFDSKLNMEGFVVSCSYAITDNLGAQATYARGERINKNLSSGPGGDLNMPGMGLNDYQLFLLDLNWKF